MIIKYLKENDYDGLCGDECGCELDDMFPCYEANVLDCQPGYKVKPTQDFIDEFGESDFMMSKCDCFILWQIAVD